ncbi:tape measure protein [Desulfosporosinus youngiae]|uniref:Tape measure domain protein n=1 Tax=Desulfosporosinus youngiae DSM 17734 TaxID=768710 RepID=H5Y2N0_9FIRM|nr:tape measure protein [Desulfosporosinus youngiae]EHQ88293.1 tape measure domain protein [Desulfosporosinus youngiae DSM 17734]
MPTISSTLRMFDGMSGPLQNITQGMNLMLSSMRRMQSATEQNTNIGRTLVAAQERIAAAEVGIRQAIDQSTRAQQRFNQSSQSGANLINQASSAQDRFNASAQSGARHSNTILTNLRGIAATYVSLMGLKTGMNISDSYVSAQARLKLINDGSQTDAQLQDKIFATADRTYGNYGVMASSVGKLGLLAGDAFSNNNEIIRFTELMQKSFKVGGSSTMEQQSGMYQLTQAMAAGKLQGDEFRSIMENAPMLASAIAKFTGKSKGELKKMSAEGTITSDIIKGALFNAADDINDKFATMPMTFADALNRMKNNALQAFGPMIERINSMLNSPGGTTFINNISASIERAAFVADKLLTLVSGIYGFISSNWGMIVPIVMGVASAFLLYNTILRINAFWTGVTAAADLASASMKAAKARATLAATSATATETAAQWRLNSALLASPITWYILAVITLISIFYIAIAAINHFAGTSYSATGFIAGAFMVAGAVIMNVVLAVLKIVINVVATIWNVIATVAESIRNVFNDPVGSIVRLFVGLGDTVLGILETIASAIDTLTGKHLSDAINGWRGDLQGMADDLVGEVEIKVPRLDPHDYLPGRFDYTNAFNKGYNWGNNISDKFSLSNIPGNTLTDFDLGNIPNIDRVGEVGKIKDKVDISNEDLKIMRELAEMKNIQNFVTLTPTVAVTTGDINNGQSVDTIVGKIKTMLETEIASSASNVYA